MEIRVDTAPLTVTMRTPGDDMDLVHGFLYSEGVVHERTQITEIRYCDGADAERCEHLQRARRDMRGAVDVTARAFATTSACGVCGKTSLEEVRTLSRFDVAAMPLAVPAQMLAKMPETLRSRQRVFASTGGLHAAGLFTADGDVLVVREDVGRHNAVDKVIGWALREDLLPLSAAVLIVSGRASFELVQKAVLAGVPMLGAVSAPSSLAVDLAAESGLTLVGFLRGESMNVYSRVERVLD